MDFGHALAVSFPLSSYIPLDNVLAVNTGQFRPDAAFYRNRYGVPPSAVKGWPSDHIQHGQSTFWLTALFHHPDFLADHPEFTGVTVAEPPSSQDMTDLQFATSTHLGGAYAYLQDRADQLGLLGSASGTGPQSSPGAPGIPGGAGGPGGRTPTEPSPASGPASSPASPGPSSTSPSSDPGPGPVAPPSPLPAPPGTTTPIIPPAAPGISESDRAELLAILERSYPGESTQILSAVDLYVHAKSGGLTPIQTLTAAVPIFGINDPKLIEELQLLAILAE